MERETELALVARLRASDPDAFEAVHAAYHVRLFNFLARLSRRRDVAEDLVEETWLRLVAHAPRLQAETRLGPWLYAVARNLYYSYCRSRAMGDALAAGLIGLWPEGTRRPSPFEETAARELEERVERALALEADHFTQRGEEQQDKTRLASLTERENAVMLLVAAGKLNKVIADELCVSVRTVEVHRARVFAKLGVRSSAEVASLLTRLR